MPGFLVTTVLGRSSSWSENLNLVMPLLADKSVQNESSGCVNCVLQKFLPEECKIFFKDQLSTPIMSFQSNNLSLLRDPGTNCARMVFKISI